MLRPQAPAARKRMTEAAAVADERTAVLVVEADEELVANRHDLEPQLAEPLVHVLQEAKGAHTHA